jgi:predicted ATPase/DNA-binding SARP family transcriptional activator
MPMLSINLLGEFRFVYAGKSLPALNSPRVQVFFAYLLLHRASPQPRQHLAFLLWPESSETQARTNLRKLLHQVRHDFPGVGHFVDLDAKDLEWHENSQFTLDVVEFENAARRGGIADLERALEIYRGDLLPNCYDDWVQPERERLRHLFSEALEQLTELREAQRDYRAAIGVVLHMLHHDPLHEETWRRLIRLYALSGDRALALKTYQDCAEVLKRELGVEPSPETHSVYQRMFKRGKTPNNLPKHLSSFVGREQEMVQVKKLLATTRLLTLTGTGGMGKTRLSLQVAEDVVDQFKDGAWFIELAPLADSELVAQTLASVVGVREEKGRPLMSSVSNFLRSRQMLIVLDNCEHVIDACARLVDVLLRIAPNLRILATSREALGITGEIVFRLPSLALPELQPLSPMEILSQYEASRLFIERASAVLPNFRVTNQNMDSIAQVCHRLDGIPLAIELAAARVNVLPVEQIAERLDDRFRFLTNGSRTALPRQQTLLASIAWSYDLLSASEQALFRRLAVFAGGWTLEAAEQVASANEQAPSDTGARSTFSVSHLPRETILDLLTQLVRKSLVLVDGTGAGARYHFLETIRAYARGQFNRSDEASAVTHSHAAYYRQLVNKAEPHLFGPELGSWLNRLEKERDNLRAALEWSKSSSDRNPVNASESLEIGLAIAGFLWRFWDVRGYITEGREWLDAILAASAASHSYEKAYALHTAGNLAYTQGDLSRAKELFQSCRSLSDELGRTQLVAHMNNNLGNVAWAEGEYDLAATLYAKALAHYREVGWTWGISMGLKNLGSVERVQGRYDRAKALHEESLAQYRQAGDKGRIALALNGLGLLKEDLAQYDKALELFQEAVDLYNQVGDQVGITDTRHNLGKIAERQGDYARAAALYESSLAQYQEIGDKRGIASAILSLGNIARVKEEYERAAQSYRESLSLFRNVGDKRGILDCLEGYARLSALQLDYERSARLFGAADALRQTMHAPVPPSERESYERTINEVHAGLDQATFTAAWSKGKDMAVENAIEFALQEKL